MREWWLTRKWPGILVDLALPAECAGCGRSRTVLCDRCRELVRGAGVRPVRPEPLPPGLPPVFATAEYRGEVRAVLLAHKERGALSLAGPLGEALALAVQAVLHPHGPVSGGGGPGPSPHRAPVAAPPAGGGVLLVPVPSARRAVAVRGHDATRRMALAAAGRLRRDGLPVRVASALRQGRPIADQSGVDARDRLANVSGALRVRPGLRPAVVDVRHRVVLVDDLLTTGASVAEAARALREAGAEVAGAAVVAAVRREGHRGVASESSLR